MKSWMSWCVYSAVTSTPRRMPTRMPKSYFCQSHATDGAEDAREAPARAPEPRSARGREPREAEPAAVLELAVEVQVARLGVVEHREAGLVDGMDVPRRPLGRAVVAGQGVRVAEEERVRAR